MCAARAEQVSAVRHEAGPSVLTSCCVLHGPVFSSVCLFMGRFWKRKQSILKWEQMGSAYYPKSFYDRIKTSKGSCVATCSARHRADPADRQYLVAEETQAAPLCCSSTELLLVCNSKSQERNQPLCATNAAETQTLAPECKESRKPSS